MPTFNVHHHNGRCEMKQMSVLVTGVSSGLGKALVAHLSGKGYRVYGTTRNLERYTALSGTVPGAEVLELDITDESSIKRVIGHIAGKEDGLDVLINNAGYGIAGAVEHTSLKEAREQFQVNFFGMAGMIAAVLPMMRRSGSGLIVNVSSVVGRMGVPFQAMYCASKHAVEGYTESLRMEMKGSGVRVVMVEPGDISTGFTRNRRKRAGPAHDDAYAERMERSMAIVERDEGRGMAPEKIAALIERIIRMKSPRLRYAIGPLEQMISLPLKSVIPYALFEYLVMDHLKL
jgi:short-subunit dehydrogenase